MYQSIIHEIRFIRLPPPDEGAVGGCHVHPVQHLLFREDRPGVVHHHTNAEKEKNGVNYVGLLSRDHFVLNGYIIIIYGEGETGENTIFILFIV